MALSHLGHAVDVQDADTEDSVAASTFRVFYDNTRKTVLRDFPWPFAKRRVALAIVAGAPTVTEWDQIYRYPAEALAVNLIPSGFRPETRLTKVAFEVVGDDDGQLIYTNMASGYIEYIFDEENTERFPPDFVKALSYLLASDMAPRITSGDKLNLGDKAAQKYLYMIGHAQVNATAEVGQEQQPASEFESSRS